MKKHLLPLLLAFLLTPVLVTRAATQTADEVIEKHLAAMGGREALGKLTSRKATGTMTVQTPNGPLSGPVELYSKAPNKSRLLVVLDLTAMGMNDKLTLDQKFDGTTAWSLNTLQGDRQITGNQLDNMKNGTFPNPFLNYKAAGTTVELLPNETLAGKSLIVLKITPKAGSVSKLFLDPDTYLAIRSSGIVNTPDTGDVEQISEVSDYRTVDGLKVPFKTVQTAGPQTVTIVLEKVEHNVTIDDAMFSVK
jgi:outer membrane lipoprotein-sorting protein